MGLESRSGWVARLYAAGAGRWKLRSEMGTIGAWRDFYIMGGAALATLIGLLGTVTGLITTFSAISDPRLSAAQKQAGLSLGISEAMYNTAFGLGIAVTCMIAHLILHQRSKNIQHDLDATQERVFNLLTIQTRPGGY